jgi:hypothetical protein
MIAISFVPVSAPAKTKVGFLIIDRPVEFVGKLNDHPRPISVVFMIARSLIHYGMTFFSPKRHAFIVPLCHTLPLFGNVPRAAFLAIPDARIFSSVVPVNGSECPHRTRSFGTSTTTSHCPISLQKGVASIQKTKEISILPND